MPARWVIFRHGGYWYCKDTKNTGLYTARPYETEAEAQTACDQKNERDN